MGAGRCPENASSTNPASRGENTASPSCTRRIASTSAVGVDRLGHVPARPGPDHGDDVLGRVGDRQGEEHRVGPLGQHPFDDRAAAAVGQVDVDDRHVGTHRDDAGHRVVDGARLTDHVDRLTDLGAHAGPEQGVVVHQVHAHQTLPPPTTGGAHASRGDSRTGADSWTSVPSPGVESIRDDPPTRSRRASMLWAMPRRSGAAVARSNPRSHDRGRTPPPAPRAAAPRRTPTPRRRRCAWPRSRTPRGSPG